MTKTPRRELALFSEGFPPEVAKAFKELISAAQSPDSEPHWLMNAALQVLRIYDASRESEARQQSVDQPLPEHWKDEARNKLRDCAAQQWHILTLLWGANIYLEGMAPPPPRPEQLSPEHFVPWGEIGTYLDKLVNRDTGPGPDEPPEEPLLYQTKAGEVKVLSTSTSTKSGKKPGLIQQVRETAVAIAQDSGLSLDQAVVFALCNADVLPARLSARFGRQAWSKGIGRDHERLILEIANPDVPAAEVSSLYRSMQRFVRSLPKDALPTADKFKIYLEARQESQRHAESDRTPWAASRQLVAYVETRKKKGMSWASIFEDWMRNHPDRPHASLQSFQTNFYQARRRTADTKGRIGMGE